MLGRFTGELGAEVFRRRVRCAGMASTVREMINAMIAQRLEGSQAPENQEAEQ